MTPTEKRLREALRIARQWMPDKPLEPTASADVAIVDSALAAIPSETGRPTVEELQRILDGDGSEIDKASLYSKPDQIFDSVEAALSSILSETGGEDELTTRLQTAKADVAAGKVDLRDIGKILFGKFDQDWPARMISRAIMFDSLQAQHKQMERHSRSLSSKGNAMTEPTTEEPDCPLCGGCGELLASTQRDSQDKIACPQCAAADLKELYQQTLAYLSRQVEELRKELLAWQECALYDAQMSGPRFKGWNRSALDRCRHNMEQQREMESAVLSSTAPSETEKSAAPSEPASDQSKER